MSTNCTQPIADVMAFTAPVGGVTAGVPILIGGLPLIPTSTVAAGLTFQGKVTGVWTVAKTITEGNVAEGQPAFWDVVNGKVSILPDVGHLPIGIFAAAALTADTTCSVRLNGVSLIGRVFNVRKRLTIAQVNAGATLVPGIPGAAYRHVDSFAIAVGGAVTSVTTVDILGTLATVSRKLVAYGQAALTQSALVRAGSAGGVILPDGASFTKNDAGAALTALKTGADITVATAVDLVVTYQIE